MRLELLGTAFTAQHSDARVLEQLLYKWSHSRAVIGEVVTDYLCRLADTGWQVSPSSVRGVLAQLLGGSYEAFMAKRLRLGR